MHDPLTVALEIKSPIRHRSAYPNGEPFYYRAPLVTIWHKDPCSDGSDDSCDWFGHKKKLNPIDEQIADLIWEAETVFDNAPYYPSSWQHLWFKRLKTTFREKRIRGWRLHPRYHVWHWRIQIHPWQQLRRVLFRRCAICGKRFGWNETPYSNWGGTKMWHERCCTKRSGGAVEQESLGAVK